MPPQRVATSAERLVDAVLWTTSVAFASSTAVFSFGPVPSLAGSFPGADKVWHGLAYFLTVTSVLLAAEWRPGRGPGPFAGMRLRLAVAAISVGGAVELVQGLTVDRRPELLDWAAEIAGVALGVSLHAAMEWASARRVVAGQGPPVS